MRSPQRILFIVTHAHWGGVQSFVIRFAHRLMDEGHEILLVAGGDKGGLWDRAEELGIPTKRCISLRRSIHPYYDFAAYRELKQIIAEFSPDAVHLNSSKVGILGSLATRAVSRKIRVVYRIGGWVFLESLPWLLKSLYVLAEWVTARIKDVIVVVHPGDEEVAHRLGITPRESLITIPNGIDVVTFEENLLSREEAREELGIPQDAFVFGSVSNAYAPKALDWYLTQADEALLAMPDAHVVIVGDGPLFGALQKQLSTLYYKERIHLVGHHANAQQLYRAFDVFVLPSSKEGMPNVLLEAMAAALPSLVTGVGATRWMLEGEEASGLVITFGDSEAFVSGMERLYKDEALRAALGSRARLTAKERFSWERTYTTSRDVFYAK